MKSKSTIGRRFRPKFSIRALVILVTLVCCYAACWGPTKSRGVRDVPRRAFQATIGLSSGNADEDAELIEYFYRSFNASAVVPLVVSIDGPLLRYGQPLQRQYFFWFFGYTAKLPFERQP